jgi:hypothetical protein
MKLIRKCEINILLLPNEDIYIIGKIIGRMEAIYSLLMKKAKENV